MRVSAPSSSVRSPCCSYYLPDPTVSALESTLYTKMGVEGDNGRCGLCIRITKWLPVVFILAVIAWSYFAFVVQLCLYTMEEVWLKVLSLIIYHISLTLFLWAYFQTIFTTSNRVPRKFKIPQNLMERIESATNDTEISEILDNLVRTQQLPVQTRTNISQIRFCEKCQIIKPDRTHHCSVCGHCILKMDHHCPWVNNCVCFDNYKFFILFLAYAFLYCLVVFSISCRYFIQFWRGDLTTHGSVDGKFHVLFVFFVAAMFAVSLVSLLGYHCYLVTKNRSTLESFRGPIFRHGPDKKGFHLGTYNNFIEVFGDDKKKWFLPVFSSLGDGISYPTRHSWNNFNGNGNYNSIDTADSTPVSGNSPDHCVEVKVEARREPTPKFNNNGNGSSDGPNGSNGTPLVYF
ncbi:palmitoyltransferase ZDHHC15B isoform X2 [Folsomia candida]|uniref:palmitoyltransferase ZDHHC15B isoform X2 n=1 Tax=Folsomia candida TaxID=158441 RepID=UPI000B8F60F9|nr:palmitoyltransferase ZDHHC15B isoform X2 [Folsomia candida]